MTNKSIRDYINLIENAQREDVAEGWDPDTQRLEQDVRDSLENGDDYTAKQYAKMAPTPEAKKYLLNIIKQAMYIDDLGGETDWKGVAESSDELYQQAIRKYVQRVANNYLGGGNAHLYGAGNFDSEMFGVDPKQAEQDFDTLFPQYLKKLQGSKQDMAEDGIASWSGNPSDRRHSGHESYMTPEYMLAHYKKRLAQIAAGKHKYPKEVAQLQAKIAKVEKQLSSDEQLEETSPEAIAKINQITRK